FKQTEAEAEVRYGSFDTYQAAIGMSAPITEGLAFRVDASRRASDGYVDRGESESVALSGSLEFRPSDNLSLVLRHDFGDQSPMKYWGTPLADGTTLDTSIRERNYNVGDAVLDFRDNRTQLSLDWNLAANLGLNATAYRLTSRRHWENLETYFYDTDADVVNRADNFGILHDVQQTGGQANLRFDAPLGGSIENRLVIGVDLNVIDLDYWHNFDT